MTQSAESSLAWLDLSEKSRQEMQEYLSILAEPGTLDELGTGQIRDVFSNLFFPGTSTLWARARYLLFVPWVYQQLEREGTGRKSGKEASRRLQAKLIRALRDGDDHDGLIGRRVLEPVNMPDELIWNGLGTWGIRTRDGSLSKYQRSLEGGAGLFDVLRGDSGENLDATSGSWWHLRLPQAPDGFLDRTTFKLQPEEAAFLRDQLQERHPDSVLARATADSPVETMRADDVWDCESLLERLDDPMRDAIEDARVFAFAMQGAGITYSYLIASKADPSDSDEDGLRQRLADALATWKDTTGDNGASAAMREWDRARPRFWARVREHNPGLRPGTAEFVDEWIAQSQVPAKRILGSEDVARLITAREWSVKRNMARLSNAKAREGARPEAGTGLLPYRWFQVRRICDDIRIGLAAAA